MADQGVWFKLHCSALDDPDLDNLDIADFGRWAKLGAFTKRHGTAGTLRFRPPARVLCAALQLPDFETLMNTITRFPHVTMRRDNSPVSLVTSVSVTFDNWAKYQGDFSSPRVAKFRQMKRSKRRGEERRREENKKREERPSPLTPSPLFKLDPSILEAIDHLPRFREVQKVRSPLWWQSMIEAYPTIDHVAQMQDAHGWLVTKGRGYRDMPGFLRNWFKRAQEDEERET